MSTISDEARAAYDAKEFVTWALEGGGLKRLLDEHERMEERIEAIVSSPDAQAALDGYEWMKAQTTARNPTDTTMLEDRLAEALLASQAEVARLRRGR